MYRILSRLYHGMNPSFYPGNPGAPNAITDALKKVEAFDFKNPRDYYGFGVFRGYTIWHAQKTCQTLGLTDMTFYGFDSFRGFPEVEGIDQENREFFKGQFACSLERTKEYLEKHGADWSRLHLIEGYFTDTLTEDLRNKFDFKPAAMAFFDCDLYASTRDALKWVTPYVAEGTQFLFDDWRTYGDSPELGQPKAFYEFLKNNPHLDSEDLGPFKNNGQTFLMHLR